MATSADAGDTELARYQALLPLTYPVPMPTTHDGLVPADDLVLEQELLRNPDNFRTWSSYIGHVEETNYRKRPLPDTGMSSEGVELLGLLSDASQRLALQRIVSIYERAIAQFPRSYRLWHRYLDARARFVLGEMRGGAVAARKRMLQTNHVSEMGPTLLDARKTEEEANQYEGGLDGVLGYQEWRSLAAAYERALIYLPRMPRLWLDYLALFVHKKCSPALSRTHARRTFDRALRTLPGSLHLRIWKVYLRWAELCGGIVAQKVWRRYLRVDPSLSERYVDLLVNDSSALHYADGAHNHRQKSNHHEEDSDEEDEDLMRKTQQRILEASKTLLHLARCALDGSYMSPDGKSPYQLLIEWLDLTERFPEEIGLSQEEEEALSTEQDPSSKDQQDTSDPTRLPVRQIVEQDGLARFPDQAGRLWTGLATYYIKRGDFDTAHDIFEQGMKQVVTVRDFTQIFDAYAETSENVIRFMMEELAETPQDEQDEDPDEAESLQDREAEVDRRMQAFEELMERRPFLVNDVLLRRNPDDVQEWEKRVSLWGGNDLEIVNTYQTAIDTIQPRKATPNLHQLYLHFAGFYEKGGSAARIAPTQSQPDLAAARQILEKAVKVPFRRVDDLAEVWCWWAEMEVRHGNYDEALRVLSRATSGPSGQHKIQAISYYDDSLPPQTRVFKSLKLWGLYTDLQESLGSLQSAKIAFDRIMELKIANAQTILNYAMFLEKQEYFEESFKVYERGVEVFTYPVAFELWNVYLSKFVKRYGGSRLERTRDLFEQALDKCPAKFCKILFLQYGQYEEQYGLLRKAMKIYQRACQAVQSSDRYNMYLYYLAKVSQNYGLAATRPIYEAALDALPDRQAAQIGLRFAHVERKLGEMDRARGIYAHISQLCNPKTQTAFWETWNAFEIEHGTEDTFREMLRLKRSVQAQYNTQLGTVLATSKTGQVADLEKGDAMAMLEARAMDSETPAFVTATTLSRPAQDTQNAEQIGVVDGQADADDDLL
ncbi:pre-mRNA-splicing factor syf1 [Malassezia yamatoensis]|uniref:Pre-mRNA-splicing factor SYF1 n=1 Tax=Malassezia yamatoensis TaxID=253288 RepID=A0AAJ6CI14_9BASI|nr:pre-mRNA-splicing factor syf1 [Malassezia yamatoensis]